MYLTYLKTAWRQLLRKRLFSFLNLFGLSMGLCTCLLISLYIADELRYDQHWAEADQLYRIDMSNIWVEAEELFGSTGPAVADAIMAELPEVAAITRLRQPGELHLQPSGQKQQLVTYPERKVLAADSTFFEVFSCKALEGNLVTALTQPNQVVLTASTAKKYFGDRPALGKTIYQVEGAQKSSLIVSAVIEDLPPHSHFETDMILSMLTYPNVESMRWSWIWTTFVTYVKLSPGASPALAQQKLSAIPPKYAEYSLQRILGTSFEEYRASGKDWKLLLRPVTDIHLYTSSVFDRLGGHSDIQFIYAFGATGLLVLMLSLINFMNLSTARSAGRAKEVGIRKVMGSATGALRVQFLAEAVLYSSIALLIAIGLCELLLNSFNQVTGKTITLQLTDFGWLLLLLPALALLTGLLAGSYPAFYLAAFQPIKVLKGKLSNSGGHKGLRNTLVIVQFSLSSCLIICTLLVFEQLQFTQQKSLGFEKENLLFIHYLERFSPAQRQLIEDELAAIPGVSHASLSHSYPPEINSQDLFQMSGGEETRDYSLSYVHADADFLQTLGVELIAGRGWHPEQEGDQYHVLLNEQAVHEMGWHPDSLSGPDSPIGKRITYPGAEEAYQVIGIIKDFHFWSLYSPIEPLAFFSINDTQVYKSNLSFVGLRLGEQDDLTATLQAIEATWQRLAGGVPFEYNFTDTAFDQAFKNERSFGQTLGIFTTLAIIIAGLGLFGLASFIAEQRKKEVGIRKVLGATVWQLLGLLNAQFLKLTLASFVLGAPLAWWLMDQWLADFTYRISPGWQVFALTIGLITLVSLATVSYQSYRCAVTNPADTLQDE